VVVLEAVAGKFFGRVATLGHHELHLFGVSRSILRGDPRPRQILDSIAAMSQSLSRRLAACCLRSNTTSPSSGAKNIKRTVVTIQRQVPERLRVPEDLPSQYWAQLPPRLRPEFGTLDLG
jgi:hypothetical protein